jgi:hypothetical protein
VEKRMKKLILFLALIACITPTAFARQAALYVGTGAETPDIYDGSPGDAYFGAGEFECDATMSRFDGDVTLGDAAGDTITVTGTMGLTQAVSFPDGTALLPSMTFTADPNTGWQRPAADSIGGSVGGVQRFLLDATGVTADAFNGDLGTVTPGYIFATDYGGSGDFYFGQDPGDLFSGYKERSDYITFQDDFTDGVDATYAVKWNVAGVVGAGTNTVTVRDGWSELVTGGAGGPDMESTVSVGLCNDRAYEPRFEAVVELAAIAGQRFEIGFYIAANELVEIVHDTAIGPNWYLQVDDTTGMETIDSLVAVAATTPTKLEIQVDNAGAITWAIDNVAMPVVGLANVMTANPYHSRWMLTDIAAAPHTAAVDYVQIETRKQP